MLHRYASLALLLGCLGCGAKQAPTPVSPAAVTPGGNELAETPPDLSPVAAPRELILVGRLARPRVVIETLANWMGLPLRITDQLPAAMKDLEGVIAWDAPVELAGALDRRSTEKVPAPLVVVSVGLVSLEKALEVAQAHEVSLTQVAPGVYRANVDDDLNCALAAAVGTTPARIVCGEGWNDVEELLPYATRGLPTRDLGTNDLHIELQAEPVRRKYNQELSALRAMAGLGLRMASLDDKRFDRVLTDIAYGLADELKAIATEVDNVHVTARLDTAAKTFDIGQTLVLRPPTGGEASFVAQMVRDSGRRQAPPPDVFWQLPAKASGGAYVVPTDTARISSVMKNLTELVDAYLEHAKVAVSLRKRVRRLAETYPTLITSSTYASGAPEAVDVKSPFSNMGWSVGSSALRADVLTAFFGDLAGLLADRELARLLKERLKVEAKLLPKARSQIVAVKGFPARATAYTFELPPSLLERLSELSDKSSKSDAASAKAAKPAKFTVVIVPDGERSFVATAPEQKQAIELLESVQSPTEKKLDSVAELQALKAAPAVYGGFWTLEMMLPYFQEAAKEKGLDLLTRMPNHGRSPWLFRVNVAERAPSLAVSMVVRVPQGAFQDGGSLIPELAAAGLLTAK